MTAAMVAMVAASFMIIPFGFFMGVCRARRSTVCANGADCPTGPVGWQWRESGWSEVVSNGDSWRRFSVHAVWTVVDCDVAEGTLGSAGGSWWWVGRGYAVDERDELVHESLVQAAAGYALDVVG